MKTAHKFFLIIGALALLALFIIWLRGGLERRVDQAIEKARAERESLSPDARLVFETDWRNPGQVSRGRAITRPGPVNDVVNWRGNTVIATDGGLIIKGPELNRTLTARDGLAGTRITCLALWKELLIVGTDDGVSIFDEKRMRSYRFVNPRANRVTGLLAGKDEVLIGAQGGGLMTYNGSGFRFHPAFANRPELMVSALSFYQDGLAVGTWDQGLVIALPGKLIEAGPDQGLIEPVTALISDRGRLLLGTPLGLFEFEEGGQMRLLVDQVSISSLARAGDEIIAATWDQGILRLRGRTVRRESRRSRLNKLVFFNQDLLALGDPEILVMKPERFIALGEPLAPETGPLSENRLTAAASGPQGRLWVGTFEHGVDVLDPDLGLHAHLEEPGAAAINCIRPGSGGRVYVGMNRGLLIYSGERLEKKLTAENGLIGESVFDVLELADGALVIATNRGITFYTPAQARSINTFHGLINNHVYTLARFGDLIAAGTLGGLSLIKDHRVIESYTMDNSALRHNWISALLATPERLYVGTFGGSAAALSFEREWKDLSASQGKLNVNPNALALHQDRLLIGTFGNGLYVFDLKTNELYPAKTPLTSRNITGLALWSRGGEKPELVVATDAGLTLLYPDELFK